MGNWRRVQIIGTCEPAEVPALRSVVLDPYKYETGVKFHCLTNAGGICGLGDWPAANMDRLGNLAERDYGPEDVAEALQMLAKAAPSLALKVHVGSDNEADECIATVTLEDGATEIGEPEVETVPPLDEGRMHANLLRALLR